ncbi:VirB4 family type IV secretion system protein [Oscillibacter ruminantium]|uniref:VirB4 family type IV secretion system protein n=1 Tax=Oscillibacter ruminantium TaxID=1263547 RepID=UPI00332BB292
MLHKREKTNEKLLTAQAFLNVEDIADDGILYSRNGYLFGFLSVRAGDNQLLSDQEREALAQNLTSAVSTGDDEPFQILSIPRTVDTMNMIEYMAEKRKETSEDAKLRLVNGEISALQEMAREGTKEPMIVIKCWEKASRGADTVLKKRLKELRSKLGEHQVSVELMNDQEITYMCKVFADLTTYQDSTEDVFEDIPLLPQKKRKLSFRNTADGDNASLLNLLTPVGGISFGVSKVTVGPVVGRIYGAMRFPSELDYGWAVDLVNNSDCVTSITYYPGNAAELGDALARSIKTSSMDAQSESNARRRKHFAKQAKDADQMIDDLDFKNAPIGHVTILAMPFSDCEDKLEDVCRSVCNRFSKKRIRLKPMGNLQKDAYKHISPYYPPQSLVEDVVKRIFPLETLMGGFPMIVSLYRDDHGSYFARTMDGGVMSLNLLMREHDRTSSNAIFTGKLGMGKSTAVKHLLMTMYMNGVKIIVIDPEREFRDLCRNLDGTWLDVGGGSAKVNPFQIRPVPEDDEDEQNPLFKGEDNAMALHIHTLDVFFKLYLPGLTDVQRALLKKALVEVYAQKNITWDTDVSTLRPEDFPIAEDVVRVLTEQDDPHYQELAILLNDMANGADSFLWNGYTNVDLSNDLIVMDTNRLINSSAEVKRAQYFNNLTLCWQMMSEDRSQPVLLIGDEAHIMFEPDVPEVSMYMRNYAKRARKYEAGLWIVTHSLVDLLNEKVKLSGQAILDCATYKVFFGTDGKNLEETADLFRLTEAEKSSLLAQEKRHALLFMGNQHVKVEFDIPAYKLELMGKGGGR